MGNNKGRKNKISPAEEDRQSSGKSLLRKPKRSIRGEDTEERNFDPNDGAPGAVLLDYRAELLEGADLNLKDGTIILRFYSLALKTARNCLAL
jgi:hypothetical protein